MKQETKEKLLKILKVVGKAIVCAFALFGVFATIAGLWTCASPKPAVIAETHSKRSVMSLASNEPSAHYQDVMVTDFHGDSVNIQYNGYFDVYRWNGFEAGVYSFTFTGAEPGFLWISDREATYPGADGILYTCSQSQSSSPYSIVYPSTPYFWEDGDGDFTYTLGPSSMVYACFYYSNPPSGVVFERIDGLDPLATYTFPREFFPYQPLGGASPMYPLISWLDMGGEITQLQRRTLDGFYFTSNGRVYDRITFDYWNQQGGDVLIDGSIINITQSHLWRIYTVYYGTAESPYETAVLRTQYELSSAGDTYVSGVYWESEVYRTIEVRHWIEGVEVEFGTQSRTPEEWLNIIVHSTPSGSSSTVVLGGDSPFDLITTAFTSWLPLLSVSVLPGISFGLLLFLPIIAGIIVVIFKVVKK